MLTGIRRAIPGTVFTVQRLLGVYDTAMFKAITRRRRGSAGILPVKRSLVEKYGLGTYVMHSFLDGAFSARANTRAGELVISSLHPHNLTVAGEICDLDTAALGIENLELRRSLQAEDVRPAHSAIKDLAGVLAFGTEMKALEEKAIERFEMARQGKAA